MWHILLLKISFSVVKKVKQLSFTVLKIIVQLPASNIINIANTDKFVQEIINSLIKLSEPYWCEQFKVDTYV